jgi:hypothetical protein
MKSTTHDADWHACKPSTPKAACNGNQICTYDYGSSMIGDQDFCAVAWSNPDVNTILSCEAIKDQSACHTSTECKWYKGKTVASNTAATVGQKAGMNFCHPPSNAKWEEQAPFCLPEMNQGACEGKGCVWSIGTMISPALDFCGVTEFTTNAKAYVNCANTDNRASCPSTTFNTGESACKWYCQEPKLSTTTAPPATCTGYYWDGDTCSYACPTVACTPPTDVAPPSCVDTTGAHVAPSWS